MTLSKHGLGIINIKLLLILFVLQLSVACQNHENISETSAIVSEEQYQHAFNIVKKIQYLPFHYKEDGCYARSLYMAMELAAERIPSSAQFAFARNESSLLTLDDGTQWRYHVAPMIKRSSNDIAMILDPSMSRQPISLIKWTENMGNTRPKLVAVPGTQYGLNGGVEQTSDHIISNFSEMPSFDPYELQDACNVMYNYLSNEPLVIDINRKKNELIERTKYLVNKLETVGKLPKLAGLRCANETISNTNSISNNNYNSEQPNTNINSSNQTSSCKIEIKNNQYFCKNYGPFNDSSLSGFSCGDGGVNDLCNKF